MNANGPDVDENWTDWTLPHIDFPHYQLSFLGHLGPYSGAYLLPPTPNLSPVCVTTPAPHLSHQITRASKHLILFGEFGATSPQGRIVLPFVRDPYLHASCAFVLARGIPEKTPRNHFQLGFSKVFQTFSRA